MKQLLTESQEFITVYSRFLNVFEKRTIEKFKTVIQALEDYIPTEENYEKLSKIFNDSGIITI